MNALLITLGFLGVVHGFVPAGAVHNVQWHSGSSLSQLPEGLLLRAATTGDNQDYSMQDLMDAVNALHDEVRSFRTMMDAKQSGDVSELPWFNSDGSVDHNGLDKFIGACKDKALCRHLRQLRDVLLLNKEDRVQELVGSSSGIMCLLAAAHAPQFLNENDKTHIVPADTLEFDLTRHTVNAVVMSDRRLAIDIAIGEASAALPPVEEAVQQLGLSLGAFKWLITMCRPDPKPEAVLVGRLCIS
ncbi:hypothetical protein JKP88DRAFT_254487 [Tribonema minus]|uniref:Uncharacterized protein n=1 Tax=Tribonema minus TaxID=303371 RepID=A0A835Z2Z5_9STRA|nr:hypothetical protein JKP88DRAFT_254487 [Tribonema minus]